MRHYIVLFIVLMFGAAVFCSELNQEESLIRQKRHFGLENDYYGGYPGYGGKNFLKHSKEFNQNNGVIYN